MGKTPLILALRRSKVWRCEDADPKFAKFRSVAKFLIEKGADITRKPEHAWSAMHVACYHGLEQIVRLILENPTIGSDETHDKQRMILAARDDRGETALVHAMRRGHTSIVFHILESQVFFPKYPAQTDPRLVMAKNLNTSDPFLY
jgi:ankyrin repeat protein